MDNRKKFILSEVKDYVIITFGIILYVFGWTVFFLPYRIVTGGVTGISAIIYYATDFPIQNSYFIINFVLLAVALKVLGLKFLMKTIYAIGMMYFMLWGAQELMKSFTEDGSIPKLLGEGNDFMSLIIGCCFTGTGLATVFLNNGSTGGTDIIAAVVNKYRNISLGHVLMAVDIIIISSSLPIFGSKYDMATGLRMMAFGFVTLIIMNMALDYVMNANRRSVQFFIFSKKYKEIADFITNEIHHGVTVLDGHGWYTGNEYKVLFVLARKRESNNIFRVIKMIDPDAFVSQSSVIGVYGEGFDKLRIKIPANNEDVTGKTADSSAVMQEKQ